MEDDTKPEGEEKKDTGATSEELGEAGKKALDAERASRKTAEKELKELQAKVKEFEDADKSESEKLQGQVADLTKKAEAATATADRWEVAIDKGLTKAQARRLVGATKEELEADAGAMAEELGLKKIEGDEKDDDKKDVVEEKVDEPKLGRPKEELKSGAVNADDDETDASKLADSILAQPW